MRLRFLSAAGLIFLALTLASCGQKTAPEGRWEGFKETTDWLLAVRLQVEGNNAIRASALSINITGLSLPERYALRSKLKQALVDQWSRAPRGEVDFDDNVLVKHGGFAPLFSYDPKRRTMTFHFYARGKLTEKVTCTPVMEFAGA